METPIEQTGQPISNDPVKEETPLTPTPVPEAAVKVAPEGEELYAEEPADGTTSTDVPLYKTNAFQEFSMNMAEMLEGGEILNLPGQLDNNIQKDLIDTPNVGLMGSADARRWAAVVTDGLSYNTTEEQFVETLDDPEAEFRNGNKHNGISLNSAVPKFRPLTGENLKGERAMIRMITHMDLGTIFQTMLWHSGIGVTFKPPVETELIELNRQMMADKIRFGRNSYGLIYSNTTVYSVERLLTFAIAHIYDLTTKSEDINMENIREHIVAQDIQTFLWGFICTMYPKGFLYERGCTEDPEKCNFVLRETINVQKLQYTNMKALTEWQKTFMSGRQSKTKTLVDVKRYKEELGRLQRRRIVINEGHKTEVAITLRSPSVAEYIDAGHQWIDTIVNNVELVLGESANPTDRNTNIALRGQATAMRQYSHWVESLELDGNIIDDREAIENNLNVLTADDVVRDKFIEAVIKYINHSTVSVIGIPTFDCPKCNKEQEGSKSLPHHVNIIPLDVVQVFFGLISQKVERIATR